MDKYEKVMKIGEGSFGKAILVKDKKDGHQYVIKEVCISGMSEKARQESRKEVAVLANMSHPNIVQYKESFEERGFLYIVMDYCEGGDLFKKINSQKGMFFPEEQILDWFVQICLALKYIHDRKILHRDIKSQNIFLTKDGTVQLGDFGIARVLNSTVELARTCIGTPYYLSPEICENKPYNNKSDIWALGCVLYEMCTLKHAFEAGNMKNLVLKIIRGSYHPVAVHYSSELRSILAQLFKHNPRERPSVSSILDKPFLFCRIQSFLPPQIIAQEFNHAIIQKQQKRLAYRGSEAKYTTHGITPSVAAKITTPACKYGVPLTTKKVSVTKKTSDKTTKDKMAPGSIHRSVSHGDEERQKQEGIKKRKMDLLDKEKKLRDQMKADQIKRHNKEKKSRINRAREEGWNNVLSSTGSPKRKYGSDSSESLESTDEAELRRKKMAVFKVQANARAAILKEQLEKKQRESNQREKEAWNDHIAAQEERLPVATVSTTSKSTTVKSSTLPDSPTAVISMTVALKNVGAMTLLEANLPGTEDVTVIQSEKKHILNRLNQNLKAQSPVDALELITTAAGEQNPTFQQKLFDSENLPYIEESNKWDPKELPVLADSQTVLEESCCTESNHLLFVGDRKKWQEQLPFFLPLSQQTLEETCLPTLDNPNQSVAISTSGEDVSLKKRTTANVEVEAQVEHVPTTDGSDPKQLSEMEAHILPSSIAEIQDPKDVESKLWEDVPEVSHTSMGLHHAWEKQDQQPLLPEVSTNQKAAASAVKEGLSQVEELLLCSSDHRRTSALALILTQSSVDESFSSLSRSRSVSPLHTREQNALLIGLSTGLFDANNPKMLRTCSLPDLSRVFSSEQDSVIVPENNISFDGDMENEDQSETEYVYDDDGLQDIRASMERLLHEESELTDNLRHDGKGDLNGNATVGKDNDFFNQIIVKLEQDNNQIALVSDNADKYNDSEECSNVDEETVELLTNGMGEENHTNENRLHEEWQSDNSEENQEGETELYDSIYSRLEEDRFNLEQQIGFEKFIEAYNKIKAIRDDEDDNIDLGTSLAFRILGNEHQHLYPNILHLVVADGAYQEGNNLPFKPWSQSQP
ncbi:serine/threonine-protein kinase Nek1 isoform X14 [Stigmatopora nigra]